MRLRLTWRSLPNMVSFRPLATPWDLAATSARSGTYLWSWRSHVYDGEALSLCRTAQPHQPADRAHQGRHEGDLHQSRRTLPRALQHTRHALEDVRCTRGDDQRQGGSYH